MCDFSSYSDIQFKIIQPEQNHMSKSKDNISDQAKELYDSHQYGNFCYGDKRNQYYPLLFDFMRKVSKGDTLFDIGCGNGYWLDTYLKHNLSKDKITALDITPSNITEIKKRGFNALCGDAMDLPFEDNVADFTVSNGVVHHTSDPFKTFHELVRITKPGGYIFISVYNCLNPYFYIVHRATYPIRYFYWNISKKIVDVIYPIAKIFIQPLAYLTMRQFWDDKTGKTMFMDQVMTPRAHLFSKSKLRKYAKDCNCEIQQFEYLQYYLMVAAIIRVN